MVVAVTFRRAFNECPDPIRIRILQATKLTPERSVGCHKKLKAPQVESVLLEAITD